MLAAVELAWSSEWIRRERIYTAAFDMFAVDGELLSRKGFRKAVRQVAEVARRQQDEAVWAREVDDDETSDESGGEGEGWKGREGGISNGDPTAGAEGAAGGTKSKEDTQPFAERGHVLLGRQTLDAWFAQAVAAQQAGIHKERHSIAAAAAQAGDREEALTSDAMVTSFNPFLHGLEFETLGGGFSAQRDGLLGITEFLHCMRLRCLCSTPKPPRSKGASCACSLVVLLVVLLSV